MKSHKEKAAELFCGGCNCSQAVFTAYCEEFGIEKSTALKMTSSLGGGFGRLREVCGAASGMALVAGLIAGYDDVTDKSLKDEHYKRIQSLMAKFKEKNDSYICREILKTKDTSPVSAPRNGEFLHNRPCLECVETACEILDETFFES